MTRWPARSTAILSLALLFGCRGPAAQADTVVLRTSADAVAEVPTAAARTSRLPAGKLAVGKFGFVRDVAGERVLVLADVVPDEWARSEPRLLSSSGDGLRVARTELDALRFPPTSDVAESTVRLYRGREEVGEVKVGRLWIASQSYGLTADADTVDDPTAAAGEAWRAGTRWLVADLPGDAPAAEWARLADLPRPAMPEITPADAEAIAKIDADLHRESAWTEAQASFDSYYASQSMQKPHVGWSDGATATYEAFQWRGERFVLARIAAGEICAFNAALGGLYRQRGKDVTKLPEFADVGPELQLLVDVDGDEELEAVVMTTRGISLVSFTKGEHILADDPPPAGCGC